MLISALVQYSDANDAGPGFYSLAKSKGLLPVPDTKDDRYGFWVERVRDLHTHHARRGSRPSGC